MKYLGGGKFSIHARPFFIQQDKIVVTLVEPHFLKFYQSDTLQVIQTIDLLEYSKALKIHAVCYATNSDAFFMLTQTKKHFHLHHISISKQLTLSKKQVWTIAPLENFSKLNSSFQVIANETKFFIFCLVEHIGIVYTVVSTKTESKSTIHHFKVMIEDASNTLLDYQISDNLSICCTISERKLSLNSMELFFDDASHQYVIETQSSEHTKQVGEDGDYVTLCYNNPLNIVSVGDSKGRITLFFANKTKSTLHWHSTGIHSLQFSEDGNYLYSSASDFNLVCWNVGFNFGTKKIMHCEAPIATSVASTDGEKIIAVSKINSLILFDPSQKYFVKQVYSIVLDPFSQEQNVISFVKDHERYLISGSIFFQVLDLHKEMNSQVVPYANYAYFTANPFFDTFGLQSYLEQQIQVIHVAHSMKLFICTATRNGNNFNLNFWKFENGSQQYAECASLEQVHSQEITNVIASPKTDGEFVTVSKDGTVKLWHSIQNKYFTCKAILDFQKKIPSSAVYSMDGNLLVVCFGTSITLWDMQKIKLLSHFSLFKQSLNSQLAFLSSTHLLVISSHCISIIHLMDQKSIFELALENSIFGDQAVDCFAVKQNRFAVSTSNLKLLIMELQPTQVKLVQAIELSSRISSMQFDTMDKLTILTRDTYLMQQVTITPQLLLQQSLHEEEEETDMEMEDVSAIVNQKGWLKGIKKSLQEMSFQESTTVPSMNTIAFDPFKGPAAWKSLFNASSQSLASASNTFQSFMDCFLLKSSQNTNYGNVVQKSDTNNPSKSEFSLQNESSSKSKSTQQQVLNSTLEKALHSLTL